MVTDQQFGEVPHDRGTWKRRPSSKPMNWAYKTMDFKHLYDVPQGMELMSDEDFNKFCSTRQATTE